MCCPWCSGQYCTSLHLHSLLHHLHQSSVTSSPSMSFHLFSLYSLPLLFLSLSPNPFPYSPNPLPYPLPLLSLSPSPTLPLPFPYSPSPLPLLPLVSNPTLPSQKIKIYLLITSLTLPLLTTSLSTPVCGTQWCESFWNGSARMAKTPLVLRCLENINCSMYSPSLWKSRLRKKVEGRMISTPGPVLCTLPSTIVNSFLQLPQNIGRKQLASMTQNLSVCFK